MNGRDAIGERTFVNAFSLLFMHVSNLEFDDFQKMQLSLNIGPRRRKRRWLATTGSVTPNLTRSQALPRSELSPLTSSIDQHHKLLST